MGGSGELAILHGVLGSTAEIQRTQGCQEALAENPNIKLVAEDTANWDETEAFTKTQNILTANPNLKAVFGESDAMAIGAAKAAGQAGVKIPDSGSMTVDGQPYAPSSPAEAPANGVALIHQEIRLLPELSVAENIFLGRLPRKGGRVDRERMNAEAAEALRLLGTSTDPRRLVSGLSMAAQQGIEIAKAITRNPRYVIFDEPSASLGESETERIFERIRVLRDRGAGVVYISHRLDEVREMADSIVCLRDGQRVADWSGGDVPKQQLVNAMVGRDFTYEHVPPKPNRAEIVLRVENLGRKNVFQGINFEVSAGEVFGIAGLVGAGRTEVVRCIAGIDRADEGSVSLDGARLWLSSPTAAIKAGVVLVPEVRKGQGLNLDRTAEQNISLPWERAIGRSGLVTRAKVAKLAGEQAKSLDIRGRLELPVSSMSGGKSAEGAAGQVAGPQAQGVHRRRADPGRRRRRQDGDLRDPARARRRRGRGDRRVLRTRGSSRSVPPGAGDVRRRQEGVLSRVSHVRPHPGRSGPRHHPDPGLPAGRVLVALPADRARDLCRRRQ